MNAVRTSISVLGFTKPEADEGIPDLLDEFKERTYILNANAKWNENTKSIDIIIDIEGDDINSFRKFSEDQAWDCVNACINFSSDKIQFRTYKTEIIKF